MNKARAILMAFAYFAAILVYGHITYGQGINPIAKAGSVVAHTTSASLAGSPAKLSKASTPFGQDNIIKFKRRRRRVIHFDIVAADVVSAPNFSEPAHSKIYFDLFHWTSLEPPTPPPA